MNSYLRTLLSRGLSMAALLILTLLGGNLTADGQTSIKFTRTIGNSANSGTISTAGYYRIIPVTGTCSSTKNIREGDCNAGGLSTYDGYIAVGWTDTTGDADALVIRMDNLGNKVWQRTYDVSGANYEDSAFAIVQLQDGDGFAIIGTAQQSVNSSLEDQIFLMVIDCQGAVSYTKLYGTTGKNECGRDIIQTQNGNGGTNTPYTETSMSGNLVLAGFRDNSTAGTDDGVLIRVNKNNGAIVWDRVYDMGSTTPSTSQEQFYAITETQVYGAGDIAIAGRWKDPSVATNGIQGLIGRVNGNTGLVTAAPQGFETYGGTGIEELYSIIEPQYSFSTYLGGLVAVGKTNSYNGNSASDTDIFVVVLPPGNAPSTGGEPCGALSKAAIMKACNAIDQQNHHIVSEVAYCIREVVGVPYPMLNGASAGDFILAGWTDYHSPGNAGDAFAWTLHQNLTASNGAVFGDLLPNSSNVLDCGYSIAQVTSSQDALGGVIICGLSDAQLCSADQRDMLIVKTDNSYTVSNTGPTIECAAQYPPDVNSFTPPTNCMTSAIISSVTKKNMSVSPVCRDWGCPYCLAYDGGLPKPNPDDNGGRQQSLIDDSLRISISSNPIKRGSELQLSILQSAGMVTNISVANTSGQTVYTRSVTPNNSMLRIDTKEWPSGVYMVKAASKGRVDAVRVIIQ